MREEPRSMTLGDVVAMVAGVAVGLGCSPRATGRFSPQTMLIFAITWGFWALAVMLVFVVAGRLARYRRRARPAEWLAILVAVAGLAFREGWRMDLAVSAVFAAARTTDWSFDLLRWALGGLAMVGVLAGLGLLRAGRQVLPPWAKTAILAVLAGLALWGPIDVVGLRGPDLLAPASGFGPGDGPILNHVACWLVARLPIGLLFGVPAVGALAERIHRRPWTWVEWASVALAMAAGLLLSPLYRFELTRLSAAWVAERGMVGAWFLAVGLLARLLVVRLGPGWGRFLDGRSTG